MRFIFQQEASAPGGKTPWPVVVDDSELIHGRPDATGIIGFSPERDTMDQATSMTAVARVTNLDDLIGQYPIFIDGGHLFSDRRAIVEARLYEADDAGIQSLRDANAMQREVLEKSGMVASTWTVVGLDLGGDPFTIAAFRGRLEPELNAECWVEYVQSLNGPEAHGHAIDQRNDRAYGEL